MRGSTSRTNAAQNKLSKQNKYLTLLIWLVGVCLSLGAYTVLVNALTHDAPEKAQASLRSFAAPHQDTAMKIDPALTLASPGGTFSVTVMIEHVADLGAFEFELTYNSTVLTATDVVTGPFLGSTGRSVFALGPTHATGSVSFGAFSLQPPANGPDGTGALAVVTFQATNVATSTLHLQNVVATNTSGGLISTSTEDGEIRVGAPAPVVTTITPDSGYRGDIVENAIVEGENFSTGASVQLTRSGQSPILASFPVVQSSTHISCTLNLGKANTGQWDVVVTNSDDQSGTLPSGFTVQTALYLPIVLNDY